jgi:purine-binding chemotaxis protein CheW
MDLFAADIASVERVLRYTVPSSVPDVPAWVEGVIEHGGAVIPVVDMRRRIGLADVAVTHETRVLVLLTAEGRIGGIVDAVNEVAVVPAASVSAPPALFRGLASQFLKGIAKVRDQLVVILDVDRVLSSADRLMFEEAALAGAASLATVGAAVRA